MSAPDATSSRSVNGDLVLAVGPGTADWLRTLDGFRRVTGEGEAIGVAVRGAAHAGSGDGAVRWAAVSDLVEGRVGDGARALDGGAPPQLGWRGRFAQLVWDVNDRRVVAVTDPFSTVSLYTLVAGEVLLVATDLRLLAASPWCARTLDLQSIYHYLNFAQIPAPGTIFTEIRRLEPSTRARWQPGRSAVSLERISVPEYPEDVRGSDAELADQLREQMVATVRDYRPDDAPPWGCFLSGGTDSSSIVSILAQADRNRKVRSFSIGFAEEGFDELGFARVAARACGADPTFHAVSRAEAQSLVSRIVEAYDQPFGNASAIPTMACTDLAKRTGVELMLAGDGGDEVFGGNERYAKDRIMEAWYSMPAPLKAVGRAVGDAVGGSRAMILNRVENFFARSSLPNPDRFYTDDSFASDHYDELLTPEFRRAVGRDASLDFMRGVFRLGSSGGPLHRVMRLDLMMAIAQNDLRKVDGAARSSGVSVRFPYLDPRILAFTGRLKERHKVRGLSKRYLFKRAMRSILPEEILRKKKQGFGLPISVWLRSDRAFQAMVRETLLDARARGRGWWQIPFVEGLFAEHERGGWDHSDYLWRLFMLEQWLRRYVDAS